LNNYALNKSPLNIGADWFFGVDSRLIKFSNQCRFAQPTVGSSAKLIFKSSHLQIFKLSLKEIGFYSFSTVMVSRTAYPDKLSLMIVHSWAELFGLDTVNLRSTHFGPTRFLITKISWFSSWTSYLAL
jgi:hypothetical protein